MDMVERVALALSEEGGACDWKHAEQCAKTAIRAMLEGLEPVAWRYEMDGDVVLRDERREEQRDRGWSETPLYDLSALKEVVG